MWKYVFLNCLCVITVEVWKCGNVEICLPCLNLSNNSGSVEMWKYVFIVLIYPVTLEVWKCGNMSSLSLPNNSGSVGVWKCGNMSSMSS